MQILSMDYMSLPAAEGYKLVLVIIDYFTQYIWAYKFKTAGTGKTTIKLLTYLFCIFGQPEVLLSNNGLHFANREVEAFCANRAIVLAKTPPYLPHTNRAVKGANGLLINALKKELAAASLDENSRNNQWPTALDLLVSQLSSRVVRTTGHRPANLLFAYVQRNEDPQRKPLGSNKLAVGLGEALTAVLDRRLEAAAHVAFSQARHKLAFETMFEQQAKRKAARNALQARVLRRQPSLDASLTANGTDGSPLLPEERPDLTGKAHESNVTYWLFDQDSGQLIRQHIHAHRLNPYHGERPRSMTHELPTLNKFFRHLRNAPELEATPVAGAVVTPGAASTDSDKGEANVDNEENPDNNNNDDNPLMMLHELFKLLPVIPNPEPGAAGTLTITGVWGHDRILTAIQQLAPWAAFTLTEPTCDRRANGTPVFSAGITVTVGKTPPARQVANAQWKTVMVTKTGVANSVAEAYNDATHNAKTTAIPLLGLYSQLSILQVLPETNWNMRSLLAAAFLSLKLPNPVLSADTLRPKGYSLLTAAI
ncbi:hypothetical protein ACM66B_003143 [Microbotryomycetes sp. NB124-2]